MSVQRVCVGLPQVLRVLEIEALRTMGIKNFDEWGW